MQYPDNFSDGAIDDIVFRKAIEQAFDGKSKISIEQTLRHSGSSPEIIDLYADRIMLAGKKIRSKNKRPHQILAWLLILGGILATVATAMMTHRVFYATLIISAIGVGWLIKMRD